MQGQLITPARVDWRARENVSGCKGLRPATSALGEVLSSNSGRGAERVFFCMRMVAAEVQCLE
jgi:hypothetical protein